MTVRTPDLVAVGVSGPPTGATNRPLTVSVTVRNAAPPPLTAPAREMVQRYFGRKTMTVDHTLDTGMPILYDTPADVGADRIVNGIAAYEKYGRAGKHRGRTQDRAEGAGLKLQRRRERVFDFDLVVCATAEKCATTARGSSSRTWCKPIIATALVNALTSAAATAIRPSLNCAALTCGC